MFEPFQRLGDTSTIAGVGLGLTVSRGLTEAMHGTLEPEETPGGGLTMAISLPAAPSLAQIH
jgi:two-component system sensor histidine kinase KdpD